MTSIKFYNIYTFRCFNRNGSLAWEQKVKNFVTNEGLNDTLNYLKGTGRTFYLGLIDNVSLGGLSTNDTAAKITSLIPTGGTNQWKEFIQYSETTRQQLVLGTPSSQAVDNSGSPINFTISTDGLIYGGFIISDSTKGGTSGILWGEAAFTTPKSVTSGQVIELVIQITDASA